MVTPPGRSFGLSEDYLVTLEDYCIHTVFLGNPVTIPPVKIRGNRFLVEAAVLVDLTQHFPDIPYRICLKLG